MNGVRFVMRRMGCLLTTYLNHLNVVFVPGAVVAGGVGDAAGAVAVAAADDGDGVEVAVYDPDSDLWSYYYLIRFVHWSFAN